MSFSLLYFTESLFYVFTFIWCSFSVLWIFLWFVDLFCWVLFDVFWCVFNHWQCMIYFWYAGYELIISSLDRRCAGTVFNLFLNWTMESFRFGSFDFFGELWNLCDVHAVWECIKILGILLNLIRFLILRMLSHVLLYKFLNLQLLTLTIFTSLSPIIVLLTV